MRVLLLAVILICSSFTDLNEALAGPEEPQPQYHKSFHLKPKIDTNTVVFGLEYVHLLKNDIALVVNPQYYTLLGNSVKVSEIPDTNIYEDYDGTGYGILVGGRYFLTENTNLSGIYLQVHGSVDLFDAKIKYNGDCMGLSFQVGTEIGAVYHSPWGIGASLVAGIGLRHNTLCSEAIESLTTVDPHFGLSFGYGF